MPCIPSFIYEDRSGSSWQSCKSSEATRRGSSSGEGENDDLKKMNSPGKAEDENGGNCGDGNLGNNAPLDEDKRNCNGENYDRLAT